MNHIAQAKGVYLKSLSLHPQVKLESKSSDSGEHGGQYAFIFHS